MAAPSVIGTPSGVAYDGGGGSSSTNLSVPTNAADDLLVVVVNGISSISMPTLSGWTKFLDEDYVFTGDSSIQYGVEAWYRISNGSEPGNYALSHNAFTPFKAQMVVVRGAADPGDIAIVADAAPDEVVDANHPAPSVTVTNDESLIIRSVCQRLTGITYTPPGSHSEIYDNGATWGSVALATTTANAGASGTGTFVDDAGWPASFMLATIAIAPLAGVAISSASINSAGDELTIDYTGTPTITNANGLSLTFSNRASRTLSYTSGSGTATHKFAIAAVAPSTDGRAPRGTTVTLDYVAASGNISDLADVSGQAVTNNSTQIPSADLPQNLPDPSLPANWNADADHEPANGAALQALLDDFGGTLNAGDVIDLEGDFGDIEIPDDVQGGSPPILIRAKNYATLPTFSATNPSGVVTAAHVANMPMISRTPSANGHNALNVSGGTAGQGAGGIRFMGIHFRMEGSYGTDVLAIVSTLTGGLASAADKLPHHLGFDRCAFSHANTMKGVQDALRLDADDSFVVGCLFPSLYGAGNDGSNATRCYRAHRILIQNNAFNCNGASGFTGDNDLTEVHDYAFRKNHHYRNSDWGTGHGNNKASHEVKTGLRVDVSENVFRYQFAAAGFGAITVKAEGTGGPKDTMHYTARGNKAYDCEQFAVILAGGSSNDADVGPNSDITIEDNLAFDLNTRGFQLNVYNEPAAAGMARLKINRNTIFGGFFVSGSDDGTTPGAHFEFEDNIFTGLFGIWFVNGGAARAQGLNNSWGANYTGTHNALIGEDVGFWDDNASPAPLGTLEDNYFPADIAAVGFNDPDADDYALGVDSDYLTASSTGGRLGYDSTTYDAIWAAIIEGGGTPPTPPTITTAASLTVREGRTQIKRMTATGDGPLSWSITGGDDAALASINATTGVLEFDDAPSWRSPDDADGDSVYEIDVACDGPGGTDTISLTVSVTCADRLGSEIINSPTAPNNATDWLLLRLSATGNALAATVTATNQKLATQNAATSFVAGQEYYAEIEATAGTIAHLATTFVEASGANSLTTWLNTTTGVIGTTTNTGFTNVSRRVVDLGSGRKRLMIWFTPSANQGAGHNTTLYLSSADNTLSWASTSGQGLTLHKVSLKGVLPPYNPALSGRSSMGLGLRLGV